MRRAAEKSGNSQVSGPIIREPAGQGCRPSEASQVSDQSSRRSMPRPTGSAPKPRCVELASVFQNPLLEEPMGSAPAAVRRRYAALVGQAEQACSNCPLIEHCLYAAVVEHDVAGYVGGTTPAQRARIRRALRISVPRGLRHPGRGDRAAPAGRPRRGRPAAPRPSRREPGDPGPPARLLAVHGEAAPEERAAYALGPSGRAAASRVCPEVLAVAAKVSGRFQPGRQRDQAA